jgi:hypothetical protein
MARLVRNDDLKTLFTGVAGMAAAGLMMGLAMQPDLDEHEVAGPQILAPGGGPRAELAAADPGIAVYKGEVPDYVYGTDWATPPEADYAEAPQADAPQADAYVTDAAVVVDQDPTPAKPVAWRDPPREPTVYPSIVGDAAYAHEPPPRPGPLGAGDEG